MRPLTHADMAATYEKESGLILSCALPASPPNTRSNMSSACWHSPVCVRALMAAFHDTVVGASPLRCISARRFSTSSACPKFPSRKISLLKSSTVLGVMCEPPSPAPATAGLPPPALLLTDLAAAPAVAAAAAAAPAERAGGLTRRGTSSDACEESASAEQRRMTECGTARDALGQECLHGSSMEAGA